MSAFGAHPDCKNNRLVGWVRLRRTHDEERTGLTEGMGTHKIPDLLANGKSPDHQR